MSNQTIDIDKKIDNLLAIGQLFIAEATELRKGPAKNGTSRKGLSKEHLAKLVSRRYKTAFKSK